MIFATKKNSRARAEKYARVDKKANGLSIRAKSPTHTLYNHDNGH